MLTQPYSMSYFFESKVRHTRINRDPNGQFTLEESKDQKTKIQVKISIYDIDFNFLLMSKSPSD
jgi:hypothetical protein